MQVRTADNREKCKMFLCSSCSRASVSYPITDQEEELVALDSAVCHRFQSCHIKNTKRESYSFLLTRSRYPAVLFVVSDRPLGCSVSA